MIESSQTSPGELFAMQLPLIDRLIRAAIRRHRISYMDAEDFASATRLRLLEDDCAVLRQFERRGNFATFLSVVIERCYLDYRAACWGKWRPLASSRRLGPLAVALERLIVRDRLSCHEAYDTLLINHGVPASVADLDALMMRLLLRPRRQMVDDSHLARVFSDRPDPEAAAIAEEGRRETMQALERALARLRPSDRRLLEMKFVDRLTVAEISRRHGLRQKALYRHVRKTLDQLRLDLQAQGISRFDAAVHDHEDAGFLFNVA